MKSFARPLAISICVLLFLACVPVGAQAADEKEKAARNPDSKAGKAKATNKKPNADKKTNEDPLVELGELKDRRREISEILPKLRRDYGAADREGKEKIRKVYDAYITEYYQKIAPRMVELALIIFEKDPKQVEAGEIAANAVLAAYKDNRYADALKQAEHLQKIGYKGAVVASVEAAAHFALHDFKKARDLIEKAGKDKMLDPRLGVPSLKIADAYIKHWVKEQEIRKREAQAAGDAQLPRVELKLKRGRVVLELFENEAPNTVANFISLVESKSYDGTKFHRVIANFVIQGGNPNTRDDDPRNDPLGTPGYTIKCECYRPDTRLHFRGSLSMAHAGRDTGGSQFFITHIPTAHLNPETNPASVHTVFGRVIEGMEVVDATKQGDTLIEARVLRKRKHEYKPEVTTNKEPSFDFNTKSKK